MEYIEFGLYWVLGLVIGFTLGSGRDILLTPCVLEEIPMSPLNVGGDR